MGNHNTLMSAVNSEILLWGGSESALYSCSQCDSICDRKYHGSRSMYVLLLAKYLIMKTQVCSNRRVIHDNSTNPVI